MTGGKERRQVWFAETKERIIGDAELAFGGSETWFLLHELQPAYVSGLYISSLFLCAAIVEQLLFSVMAGQDICDRTARMTLGDMIGPAVDHGILSDSDVESVRELKQNRTAFYHYRDLDHEDAPIRQQVENVSDSGRPEDMEALEKTQRDAAESAIRTVFELAMKPYNSHHWYYYLDGRGVSINRLGDPFTVERLD